MEPHRDQRAFIQGSLFNGRDNVPDPANLIADLQTITNGTTGVAGTSCDLDGLAIRVVDNGNANVTEGLAGVQDQGGLLTAPAGVTWTAGSVTTI